MSEETVVRALRFAQSDGSGSAGVIFFGGEPLLERELIASTIREARRLERDGLGRFHFKITTNGLGLDDDFLELSLREDVIVGMSFDGTQGAHDLHRRLLTGGPSWEVLKARLQHLLEVRPYSPVLLVVSPDTAHCFADSVMLLVDLGCRYIVSSQNHLATWEDEHWTELEAAYRRLAREYVGWMKTGRKVYFSPFEVKLASHIQKDWSREARCKVGRRQLSVGTDGSLYPCIQFASAGRGSSWCIGDVTTGIRRDALDRVTALADREREPCAACAIEPRCNATCACINWQTSGSVTEVSPVLCRHEQTLLPIVDAMGAELFRGRTPLFIQKHYNRAYPLLSLIDDAGPADACRPSPRRPVPAT